MTKLTKCIDGLRAKHTAILGAQWGDEGKGKLVDILAEKYDICGRFNGTSFLTRRLKCRTHCTRKRQKIRFSFTSMWHSLPKMRERFR